MDEHPGDTDPMEPSARSTRPQWATWPITLGVFGLLLLVTYGARRPPGSAPGTSATGLQLPVARAFLILGILAALFVVTLLVWAMLSGGIAFRTPPRQEGWMKRTLIFMAVFAVVAFAFSFFPEIDPSDPEALPNGTAEVDDPAVESVPWKWLVLGAGLTAGLTIGWLATRRSDSVDPPIRTLSEPETSDPGGPPEVWAYEIPAGDDPHARVIQNYAAMEAALERAGLPRQMPEAPFEYAARVARRLPDSAHEVAVVTELFVRARFSDHAVDTAMENRSSGALAALLLTTAGVNA